MCSAKKVAALQAKEEVGKSEVFDCRFCLLIQTVCTNWWVSLVYSWQNFVLYGVKDSSTSQKILWFLKFSDWHGMCNACFFPKKNRLCSCATSNIRTYIPPPWMGRWPNDHRPREGQFQRLPRQPRKRPRWGRRWWHTPGILFFCMETPGEWWWMIFFGELVWDLYMYIYIYIIYLYI